MASNVTLSVYLGSGEEGELLLRRLEEEATKRKLTRNEFIRSTLIKSSAHKLEIEDVEKFYRDLMRVTEKEKDPKRKSFFDEVLDKIHELRTLMQREVKL